MVNFRKSKKIGPLRLTASKSGLSVSGGVRGARVSTNTKGEVRRTVGIPGTGIYDTKRIGGSAKGAAKAAGGKDAPADYTMRATYVDATGGEHLGKGQGTSIKAVGVRDHADLARFAGFTPRQDGWVGGLRHCLLVEQGDEYRVLLLVEHGENPALFGRKDDKTQPKGVDIGRVGARDLTKWGETFAGRTVLATLFLGYSPMSNSGQAEVRFHPEMLEVTEEAAEEVPPADEEAPTATESEQTAPAAVEATWPAGWYADPQQQAVYRYWDGTAWTEHVSDGA